MELKINDNWLLISGNDDSTNYHKTNISPDKAHNVSLPCLTHMYIEDHVGISWYQNNIHLDTLPNDDEIMLISFEQSCFITEVSVNGQIVGVHIGVEDPFTFDITDKIKKGDNLITVRTSKPHTEDVDGYTFAEIPHRNQSATELKPGACYNVSGIYGEVSLKTVPKVYIDDIYLNPDPKTGIIDIELTLNSKYWDDTDVNIKFKWGLSSKDDLFPVPPTVYTVKKGENIIKTSIKVEQYELWSTENPILYSVIAELYYNDESHIVSKRCGFRTFEVKEDGHFYLNDKRILLKGSHTGNCFPLSTHHIALDKELLRQDFILAKSTGFNMVRFISGAALPVQLDLCDEIGLMIYEEPVAGWLTKNGPHAKECFRHDMLSMIKRDRSHACVTIWGLLNETHLDGDDSDLYEAALNLLPELRKLDNSRLAIFSSGRWDGYLKNGSYSNPGSTEWECLWNGDGTSEDNECDRFEKPHMYKEVGDIHYYGFIPRPKRDEEYLRTLGKMYQKQTFMSEFGIGSVLDTVTLVNRFEQDKCKKIYPDLKMIYQMNDIFHDELKRYGFDKLYPISSQLVDGSMENHAKYREFDFDLLRSNPYINGISLTGLLDHSICGEGLWTLYREFKPHMADVLQTGFSPLMWCIIPEKKSLFIGEDFKVEVLISHEDKLELGKTYDVKACILKSGRPLEMRTYSFCYDDNSSFVQPVFTDSFKTDNLSEGEYTFKVEIFGADIKGGERRFRVYNHTTSTTNKSIYCIDITDEEKSMLKNAGYTINDEYSDDCIVLAGRVNEDNKSQIDNLLSSGATVISMRASDNDDLTIQLLPEDRRPVLQDKGDWLYHQESVVNYESPLFTDLPAGTMDVDVYGDILTSRAFIANDDQVPDETHAIAYCMGYPSPTGYIGGYKLASFNLDKGKFVINTYKLLNPESPIAEKILVRLIDNI